MTMHGANCTCIALGTDSTKLVSGTIIYTVEHGIQCTYYTVTLAVLGHVHCTK